MWLTRREYEAELRALRAELRMSDTALAALRDTVNDLAARVERLPAQLEVERLELSDATRKVSNALRSLGRHAASQEPASDTNGGGGATRTLSLEEKVAQRKRELGAP